MEGRENVLGTYKRSLTSRAWVFTPYTHDLRYRNEHQLKEWVLADSGLGAILEEESNLGKIPAWATEILNRLISTSSPCGHYTFPSPLLQVVDAIKDRKCPAFVIGCFTADPQRKKLMFCYVYCLDAWLKGTPLDIALSGLQMLDDLDRDWNWKRSCL